MTGDYLFGIATGVIVAYVAMSSLKPKWSRPSWEEEHERDMLREDRPLDPKIDFPEGDLGPVPGQRYAGIEQRIIATEASVLFPEELNSDGSGRFSPKLGQNMDMGQNGPREINK